MQKSVKTDISEANNFNTCNPIEVVQRPLIWDIAPEMSNFAIFGFYLEN
jgi:hypothetical protein